MEALKSILHNLKDCENTKEPWHRVIKEYHWSKFISLDRFAWVKWNLVCKDIDILSWDWSIFFEVMVWALLKDMTVLIFSLRFDMGEKL